MIVYELIVRFSYNKCRKGFIWCVDGDFINPSKFKESGKLAYGYVLTDNTVARLRRSTLYRTWTNAKSYCTIFSNSGKYGYCPNIDELRSLYYSIMTGKMKEDLIEAGIYEECNYRLADYNSEEPNWCNIWSSSEIDSILSYAVGYNGYVCPNNRNYNYFVIPFFKF